MNAATTLKGSWSVTGPIRDASGAYFWTWNASGPGMATGGQASTRERAAALAQASHKRLNP